MQGIQITRTLTIKDTREAILETLEDCGKRADLVIITGGLGPTKDDVTKQTLCEFFDARLVMNAEVLQRIENYFHVLGRPMLQVNRDQALLPDKCIALKNDLGTASGMWFEKEETIYVSLPGVPYEMKALLTQEVLPEISRRFKLTRTYYRSVLTQGIGESFLADIIKDWETNLRHSGLSLAYLPSPGIVKLRVSGNDTDPSQSEAKVEAAISELESLIPEYIFGYDKDKLEEIIGKLLVQQGKTLSTAESCTGGYMAHLITSVPGSSEYFKGSVIAYSNSVKQNQLGVSPQVLSEKGAVSSEVVEQMAKGAKALLQTDYAIATSGIAGPDGGTEKKPVGLIWIAVSGPKETISKEFLMGNNRERNIRKTALTGFLMLRKMLLSYTI